MAELKELNPDDHGDLKVAINSAVKVAKNQHLINLKVSEVGHAVTSFPVFLTKVTNDTAWAVSAIASFEMNSNLFVENDEWRASYQPTSMQTYPFFLMKSPRKEGEITMGIEESNQAFSKDEGEALFDKDGKASVYLSRVTAQLQSDFNNEIHTHQFTKKLDELGMIKAMDLQIHYAEGAVNTLKGLNTIDEEKLQNLEVKTLDELRKAGYLGPIYGMLISIYQLNAMIIRHNEAGASNKVVQVKLEAPKDQDT